MTIKPTFITLCLAKNFLCLPSSSLYFMEKVTPCEAGRLYREMSSSLVPVTRPVLGKALYLGLSLFIFKVRVWAIGVPFWNIADQRSQCFAGAGSH